ncbi:amphi-Trp domain-containing protein [Salinirussus salinus]|jgi:amphi-Trp domain-containing protein|uniref:amphi-Trp domain-containing protein n=1 Tax=Salinirussus salinus TaxID=1198300 RepID=UPI00135719F0|nr:amphi-Trp domain-containing protein [Salinirussus salinus]
MEDVLFESESKQSRAEIADYLRRVADSLEAGDDITLRAGDQSVTLAPPPTAEFEVKAEREHAGDGTPGELSVEFEVEWDEDSEGGSGGGDLTIE